MSVFQQVIVRADLPAAIAAAVPETPLGEVRGDWLVTEIGVVAEAAMTGATATARTITVFNRGQAGAGTTVLATLAFITGVDLVANDKKILTLSVVANALNLADGDALEVVETVASTGTARPNCQVTVVGTHR